MEKKGLLLIIFLGILTGFITSLVKPQSFQSLREAKVLMAKIENNEGNTNQLMREITYLVGPEAAINLLNGSSLPKAGQTHLIAHAIGEAAYKLYGEDALPYCGEDALNGCAHGLILNAIEDIGFEGIARMASNCKSLSLFKFHMCLHAAGHAFLAYTNYDIKEGLKYCDFLGNLAGSDIYHCYNGVFMENVHGQHDGKSPFERTYLSKDDLFMPCNIVEEKYQSSCYLNQAGWWYQVFAGDHVKTAQNCRLVPVRFRRECADNFGRILSTLFKNDFGKIQEGCNLLGAPENGFCLSGIAQSLFALGDETLPFELCRVIVEPEVKGVCYGGLATAFVRQDIPLQKRESLCTKFSEEFQYLCKNEE